MYKHQSVRSPRDSWQDVRSTEDQSSQVPIRKPYVSRRESDPITILSACESEKNAASRGILPAHIGGVFAGRVEDAASQQQTSLLGEDLQLANSAGETATMTSLGDALEEVLDSVDAATELHQRTRSNSRIQEWLGHQSELRSRDKTNRSVEDRQRTKLLTEKIIRDLLGIDKTVLDLLLRRPQQGGDEGRAQSSNLLEMKLWKRWLETSRRDTRSLAAGVGSSSCNRKHEHDTLARSEGKERTNISGLEQIPWGVPEEANGQDEWNEEFSIAMIFRYLKARLIGKRSADEAPQSTTQNSFERNTKHIKTTQSIFTRTEEKLSTTTATNASTITVPAGQRHALGVSTNTSSRLSRHMRQSQHDRSRSRTSQSPSFRTVSLRTGTCSVTSMRRSMLGSNFWDLGSLGGGSVSSRDVGGNWSVYA